VGAEAAALCPRILYAANDRVYEHAELVPLLKRERGELVASIERLDPAIPAATGWPIVPTGERWRE
jgi:hypothetical protein